MEIAKINITSFKGLKSDNNQFVIKPNNSVSNDNKATDKSSLILKMLITSGKLSASMALKQKSSVLNNPDKTAGSENNQILSEGNNLNDDITVSEAETPKEPEEIFQDEITDDTETAEENEDDSQLPANILPSDTDEDTIKDTPLVIIDDTDIQEAQPEDEQTQMNPIDEKSKQFVQYELNEDNTTEEVSGIKEKFVGRKKISEEEHQRRLINHKFIKEIIKKNQRLFDDFGIDPELLAEYRKLDTELIKEITEPEFLSLILAPTDKLSITFEEATRLYPRPSKIGIFIEKTILRGTGIAKRHRVLGRKFQLSTFVKAVNNTNERKRKLKALGKMFSAKDMNKIFNSESKNQKTELLRWLIEFHTKGTDEKIMLYLDSYLNSNQE